MGADPWTDPDPKPGDFDDDFVALDPRYVERHDGDPEAKLNGSPSYAGSGQPTWSPSSFETPTDHSPSHRS